MAALPLLMTSAPLRAESETAATVDSTNYSLILRYTGGGGTSMIAVPFFDKSFNIHSPISFKLSE